VADLGFAPAVHPVQNKTTMASLNTDARRITAFAALVVCVVLIALVFISTRTRGSWDPRSAAAYLDRREHRWAEWPPASRDHGTFCVACHTSMLYAMARPALRAQLAERAPSIEERKLISNVTTRVRLWKEIEPYYQDMPEESRGTEAVLNALILASNDSQGHLSPITVAAFDRLWETQLIEGSAKGSWPWIDFDNQPWEAPDSPFYGACLAAVAVGTAPDNYRSTPAIQERLALLRDYLNRESARQSPVNRITLLWASVKLPGLLTDAGQNSIMKEILAKQQEDGGWSLSSLVGSWTRYDATPLVRRSDAYATGLILLVLEQMGQSRDAAVKRGLRWLARNQRRWGGQWPAYSLNKRRHDPFSNVARFMDDAATSYAVLALTQTTDR
jgi:squalene-hopene/tetraprenyl-beta-curcumene cyclase